MRLIRIEQGQCSVDMTPTPQNCCPWYLVLSGSGCFRMDGCAILYQTRRPVMLTGLDGAPLLRHNFASGARRLSQAWEALIVYRFAWRTRMT